MNKKQLYLFVTIFSLTGVLWVALNEWAPSATSIPAVCLFRKATGLPCPACGSTHAVLKLAELHPAEAFYLNPFGFILAAGLVILPFWMLYDGLSRKSTFYSFYTTSELFMRRRWVSAALVLLVTANWLWNIYKFTA